MFVHVLIIRVLVTYLFVNIVASKHECDIHSGMFGV